MAPDPRRLLFVALACFALVPGIGLANQTFKGAQSDDSVDTRHSLAVTVPELTTLLVRANVLVRQTPPEQIRVLGDAQEPAGECTSEEIRRLDELGRKALVGFYVIGPVVAAVINGLFYQQTRRLSYQSFGVSIGAGLAAGIGAGQYQLTKAHRLARRCWPR